MKEKSLKDIGEFGLIELLRGQCSTTVGSNVVGIGDDCAVFPLKKISSDISSRLLITSDTMVEGVHFKRQFTSADALGHKLLAVSLSDIAAMGGRPLFATLNLQLPTNCSVSWLEELYSGIVKLANAHSVSIVGGDTVSAKELALTATVVGIADKEPLLRSQARVGDLLWLSGSVGGAYAGLSLLQGKYFTELEAVKSEVMKDYCQPDPQIALGRYLLQSNIATAAIDISDGLFRDAEHIANQSNVSIELDLTKIPVSKAALTLGVDVISAVTGGDDYQLLFTASSDKDLQNVDGAELEFEGVKLPVLSAIGKIHAPDKFGNDKVVARTSSGDVKSVLSLLSDPRARGFEHFV